MRPDPPVRSDGRCYTCHGPRSAHRKAKPLYHDAADRDPFCSSSCARDYHDCELPPARPVTPAMLDAASQAADRFRYEHPFPQAATIGGHGA